MLFPLSASFLLFSLSSAFSFGTSNNCPKLIDGQMLDFVNPGGIRLTKSRGRNCDRLLSCDVIGAPVELTNVHWYVNGKKIQSSFGGTVPEERAEPPKRNGPTGQGAIGVGEVSHRLCADHWLVDAPLLNVEGSEMRFHCVASLDCGQQYIESAPLTMMGALGRKRRTTTGVRGLLASFEAAARASSSRPSQPPLISMVTSSRMELTGLPLSIACTASGVPKPRIGWDIVGVDGIELDRPRPAEQFPFVTDRGDGQLLIDSSSPTLRDVASISLRCTANNGDGEDSAKSLVILLSDERK